ncbi:hypothetical protein V6N13_054397 [Hibiscus sabdariffa]|uniref:Uncharacterized protein n=1 Tax=Hibiscus sabdariffa TaxID=183260 RepID=A0ABR2DXX7_9ROSI
MISCFFTGSIANVSKVLGCLNGTDSQGCPLESKDPPRELEPVLILPTDFIGLFHYVIQVGIKNQGLVSQPSLLLGQWLPGEGLGLPLSHNVFPNHTDAIERVDDAIIVGETECYGAEIQRTGKAQAAIVDGNRGT